MVLKVIIGSPNSLLLDLKVYIWQSHCILLDLTVHTEFHEFFNFCGRAAAAVGSVGDGDSRLQSTLASGRVDHTQDSWKQISQNDSGVVHEHGN